MLNRINQRIILAVAFLALSATGVQADDFSTMAFDNATVWYNGPRAGDNGKIFLDIEGVGGDPYESFGVADFDSSTMGIPYTVANVTAVTVGLTEDIAAFSVNGTLNFYITEDTTTSIQPDDNAVFFDTTDSEGLNGQLSPIHFLGSGTFTQNASGTLDAFTFTPDSDTAAYLTSILNNQGTIRLVVTPADSGVAATYSGFSNSSYVGPIITVSVTSAN